MTPRRKAPLRLPGRKPTRLGRFAAACAVIGMLMAGLLVGGPAAGAPVAEAPAARAPAAGTPAAVGSSAAPALFADTLAFTVQSISPSVVTSTGGNTLAIRGTIRNTSAATVTRLIYRLQRGAPLANGAAVSKEIASPGEPTSVIGDFTTLGEHLEPGRTMPFVVAAGLVGSAADSLRIDRPGVYPLLVNVNGTIDDDGVPRDARLGELHLLVTVTSLPTAPGSKPGTKPGSKPGTNRPTAMPLCFLWPVSSRPHRGVAGIFLDDSLAAEIGPAGALTDRLDALAESRLPAENITLTIDPMLLDELDQMSRGYRVQAPGSSQGALTRVPASTGNSTAAGSAGGTPSGTAVGAPTSAAGAGAGSSATPAPAPTTNTATTNTATTNTATTNTATTNTAITNTATTGVDAPLPDTVAGTGGAAAAAFLQRLRQLAGKSWVLVLPYSNPDVVALTRSGMGSNLKDLAGTGRSIATRVLGRTHLITTVALPPDGLADPATLAHYQAAGFRSVLLSGASVTGGSSRSSIGRLATAGDDALPALLDNSELRPVLTDILAPTTPADAGRTLNTAVALIGQRALDGDRRPMLRMPDSTISTAGLDDLGAAVAALAADGAVRPADPAALTADVPAAVIGTAVFPDSAAADLLPAGYLGRLTDVRADAGSLTGALTVDKTDTNQGIDAGDTTGLDLIRSIGSAVRPLSSVSLRSDRGPSAAVFSTVAATIDHLRAGVTIRPTVGSYTLASTDSPLVLTVQNTLPFPVRMKMRIDGGQQAGLITTVPPIIELAANSRQQVKILATVSRAGSFSVSARLMSPDGRDWNLSVLLPIRSNAYGTLTIILITVAGGVLLLMVVWRIWQRYRARQHRLATERAAGDAPPPPPAAGSITASVNDPAERANDSADDPVARPDNTAGESR